MTRNDLDLVDWLIHLQQELMDACVYIEKLLVLADGVEFDDNGKAT